MNYFDFIRQFYLLEEKEQEVYILELYAESSYIEDLILEEIKSFS